MSFLLTEVALEMMGFKYYGIDGTCMMMNFQDKAPGAGVPIMDEKTLSEMLSFGAGVPSTENATDNAVEVSSSGVSETVEIIDDEDDADGDGGGEGASTSEGVSKIDVNEESKDEEDTSSWIYTADHMLRSLSVDYKKVYKEILKKRETYSNVNPQLKDAPLSASKIAELRKVFIEQETKSLNQDCQTMEQFRVHVENYIKNLNPEKYREYEEMLKRYSFFEDKQTDLNPPKK